MGKAYVEKTFEYTTDVDSSVWHCESLNIYYEAGFNDNK